MDKSRRELMNIEVKTSTAQANINLADDLEIHPYDINAAYIDQPGKFAYWSTVAIQAKFAYERKKQEVSRQEEYLKKTLYGEIDKKVRVKMEMNGDKITEAKVANHILTDTRYLEEQQKLYDLQDELLECQRRYSQLDMAKEAMNQRKDMLISLGAQLRLESDNSQLSVRRSTRVS